MTAPATNRRLLFVISYHHACNDGALIAIVALLPILVDEMSLTFTEIGILGLGLLITVVVQLIIGRLTDRASSRYLLEVGAALMALSFILVLFVSDFVGLFLAIISMRIGASFYHPVGISWITREYGGPYLDTSLGIQSGIGNFGVIAALASSGFLGEAFGWKVPCIIWAALNIGAVVIGLAFTKSHSAPDVPRTRKRTIRVRETLSKISHLTVPIAAGGALYSVTIYFGPVNLTTMHGWSAGEADLLFAVWLGVGTISSYFYGAVRARFDRGVIVSTGYAVSVLSLLALFMTSSWYLVMPVLVVFGAALFLTYPALFAIVSEATSVEERGTAFGVIFAAQLGGAAAITYVCGVVADHFGDPSAAYPVTAVLVLASLVLFVAWKSRHGGRGPDE